MIQPSTVLSCLVIALLAAAVPSGLPAQDAAASGMRTLAAHSR